MTFHFNSDKKYCISKDEINSIRPILTHRENYCQQIKDNIFSKLELILNPNSGIIDGDSLKSLIFPTEKWDYDVFISHSHNNIDEAKKLAAYLSRKKGKKPFLDNFVWGSADELLRNIDEDYCRHYNGRSFDYSKRNFSTSHVHTMLSMAIFEMIARCETFIFIDSDESLDFNELKGHGTKTHSPWLYQELQYARMLSIATDKTLLEQRMFSQGGQLKINYSVDLRDFKRLNAKTLITADI